MVRKLLTASVVVSTLATTTFVSMTPAAAWCRWGRCGGAGPVVAGVAAGALVGAVVGAAVAAPVAPVVVAPRACPPGFHLGPAGRACRPNY